MIQCAWTLRAWQEREVKRLEIEESLLLGDKILREEVTIGDMMDPNHMIIKGDLSHRMVEEEDSISNFQTPNHDMVNMIKLIKRWSSKSPGKEQRKEECIACLCINCKERRYK